MHYAFWCINCHKFFLTFFSAWLFSCKKYLDDAWQRNRESVSVLCYVQNTTCMVICIENFSDWLTRGIWIVWSSSNVWMENYSTQNTLVQKIAFIIWNNSTSWTRLWFESRCCFAWILVKSILFNFIIWTFTNSIQ